MVVPSSFFKTFFEIERPYLYQEEVWHKIKDLNFPILIKAPAGSGKTEAVLAPFLHQFIDNKFQIAPRMIYVLPMRVLVNNIYKRIKSYASKISPHISVEIQHGDIPNSPFFMEDIVVTTLDQFIYAFARTSSQVGHHIDVPAGAIASSIVIFDEAHMYRDDFTFSIMRALMEILHKSNIPFVLMTATMPISLEKSLFEEINLKEEQKIVGDIKIERSLKISIEEAPLYENNSINISDDLLNKIKNKKTLIILNQVKRAQKVYEDIKSMLDIGDDNIVLLHSRFTKIDRKEHEEKAISLIPHKENGNIKISEGIGIVISTQVLEAGIDFSAELLLTELAPADSLIQRAGRCARYEGKKGEMIIFPVEEDKGHLPYEKEHLSKTFEWLNKNKHFNIKNFKEVCSFVDDTLNYQANDYEARDTLIDLYECVLYADDKPSNIQIRDGKPITLFVVDFSVGKGKNNEEKIKNAIRNTNIDFNSINVDIGVGYGLLKNRIIKYGLNFNNEKGEWDFYEIKELRPFKYYILEKSNYDSLKGIVKNEDSFFI